MAIIIAALMLICLLISVDSALADYDDVPAHVVIDIPDELSTDWVPLGGQYDIYALVYDKDWKSLTDQAEVEWSIEPDIASWRYISVVGMQLFTEAPGELTIHAKAWVNGRNVTTALDLTLVTTVSSVEIQRVPESGFVYPDDELVISVDLLDLRGEPILFNTSFEWNTSSGTLRNTVDPARVGWTAGPTGTALVTVEYVFMRQAGSASITIEVLSRLDTVTMDDLPVKAFEGIIFEFRVTAVDSIGADVTDQVEIRPAFLVGYNMSEFDWYWNATSGYMGIRPLDHGPATIDLQVVLNGITLTASEEIEVFERGTGSPTSTEPKGTGLATVIYAAVIIALVLSVLYYIKEAKVETDRARKERISDLNDKLDKGS